MTHDVPKENGRSALVSGIGGGRRGWFFLYGFFLVHMAAFGSAGFFLAYGPDPDLLFSIMFSGFAIFVYIIFYLVIFGLDEIRWLFINSLLGIMGIAAQLDWLLRLFGRNIYSYPIVAHIIPGIYYVLYTFLLRRAILHVFHAAPGTRREQIIDRFYVVVSLLIYVPLLIL